MARALAALVLAGLMAAGSGCGSAEQRPAIRIVHWSVEGSSVILDVKIDGWKMAPPRPGPVPKPHTGQWQIFADDRYAGFSYEPSYGMIEGLAGGTYKIWVALARTDYSLVYPLIRSQPVTVHVGDSGNNLASDRPSPHDRVPVEQVPAVSAAGKQPARPASNRPVAHRRVDQKRA